ncbi:hypothetical protein [Hugenholtzia roseola]|uniref:hypothetical protein n=1 Tax=Hugenholtzia roseola TaxID=1002 RepID=UPI000403DE6E|nr:hypothetical protein [Hugenholtzia roseola]
MHTSLKNTSETRFYFLKSQRKKAQWVALCALCFVLVGKLPLFGQLTQSPYSRFGLGDLVSHYHISQQGMGGMGVSWISQTQINLQNPATLHYNRLTTFDIGIGGEYKELKDGNQVRKTDFAANVQYLTLAFPVIQQRWSIALGFQPYSHINYKTATKALIPQTPTFAEYIYQGRGGVSQLFLAQGFKIIENLSLGIQANYNFGATRYEMQSILDDPGNLYIVELLERVNYSDLHLKLGLHYKFSLLPKQKIVLNIGASYEPENQLNTTTFQAFQRKINSGAAIDTDTLRQELRGDLLVPEKIRGGISIQRGASDAASLARPMAFAFGVDYERQDWSKVENFALATKICIGGEITPNVRSTNRFSRSTYRLGFSTEKTPYLIEGTQIDNRYLSFGVSLAANKGFSALNLSFVAGERGKGSLIEERYLRFGVGLNITDRWFVRPKIE